MSKRLFLSCATSEFAFYRDTLTADLRRPNLDVKSHAEVASFVSGQVTLEKLDRYIANCDAVVHLVGDATGSSVERAEIDAFFAQRRVSIRLHLADLNLHRARLVRDKETLKRARALIEQGWHRKQELEDAEGAAKRSQTEFPA